MTGLPDLGTLIGAAWAEAARRGVDMRRQESTTVVTEIAMQMVADAMERQRTVREAERGERLRRQFKRDPLSHPDNFVGVIFPDGHATFYRKDLGPPPEVVQGLATGGARIIGSGNNSCRTEPTVAGRAGIGPNAGPDSAKKKRNRKKAPAPASSEQRDA